MDGTPHLLTDVKFSERRKGYDPDEVDNFLERVSAAVAQLQDKLRDATTKAEEADARINEAKRGQATAEAQVDQLKADLHQVQTNAPAPAAPSSSDDAEKASALLVMAQKTADAAVDDARRKADATLTEARAAATTLVGDAEADADRIRSDARRIADDMVEQKRAAARAEVAALEELKGQIQFDVDVLQRHVDEERSSLRNALTRLGQLVEDPAAFRVSAPPAATAPSAAAVAADRPAAGVEAIDEVDDVEVDADIEVESEVETPAGDAESPAAGLFAAEPDDETVEPGPPTEAFHPFMEPDESGAPSAEPGKPADEKPADEKPAAQEPADQKAEGSSDEPGSEGQKPNGLGSPNADEDQAMRAFFETDFETVEAEEKRSRWRR